MDVLKVFEELDSLVKPAQAQLEDPSVSKAFRLNLERFLQHARPQLSWSYVFHERMLKTHNILSQDKYVQYVDSMKWYIEDSAEQQANGQTLTKMQRMCVTLANNLLDFLQVHKMDTDSALIGLSPSNFTFDACTEQERHLPHQLMGWKTLDGSGLKQEVRKTAEKVVEWTSVTKGDLLIIRKSNGEQGLVYARYSGEKSQTQGIGSSLSVWVDVFESTIERVPLHQVFFLNPYTKQTILSRKEPQISKTILHPAPIFFRKLDAHAQSMTYKYLMSLGIEWKLIMSLDSNSLYMQHVQSGSLELAKLAQVKQILSSKLTEEAKTEYLEKVKAMADEKAEKYIEQLDYTKIFLPEKEAMKAKILLFPSDIKEGEGRRLQKFVSKVDFAFDSLCLQYLGRKKDELNDRILLHIEHETNFFLQSLGFDYTAVPDNYIEHPPSSLAVVAKNLSLLKALLVKGSQMYTLASRVRGEIGEFVFCFLRDCYIAILASLGREVPLSNLPTDSPSYIKHLTEVISEIKAQVAPNIMREKYRNSQNITELTLTMSISDDKIRKCSSLISELEVLYHMTIEHEIKEKNVNDVTFGGLVINVFVRLSEEMKTVLEHWDKKEPENKENRLDNKENSKKSSKTDLKKDQSDSGTTQLSPTQPLDKLKKDRDYSSAVGNWVAARRTQQSSKTLGEFKKTRGGGGGSDLSLSGEESESPKEGSREDVTVAAARTENGKDENQLAASTEVSPPAQGDEGRQPRAKSAETSPVTKGVSFPDEKGEKGEQPVSPRTIALPRVRSEDGNEFGGYLSMAPRRPVPVIPKPEDKEKLEKERAEKPERPERPERPQRPDRASQEKLERPERPPERNSQEKPERAPERNSQEKPERPPERNSHEKLEAVEKPEKPEKPERPEKEGSREKLEPASRVGPKKGPNLLTLRDKGRTTMRTFNIFGSKETTPKPPPAPVDPLQLQAAATQNHANLAYELISQGMHDINIQDKQGWTALHCAAHNVAGGQASAIEMMILLLTVHGIDANIPNDSQATPLHIAVGRGRCKMFLVFLALEIKLF
eukprot:Phypoly_transcript_01063.p1 GENE.Phypoly_transcript_01063~~Phypoly_transcript_01063.p1  ORF type:complete len:1053 (+),score=175.62 Phypoly_transcript_01063:3-3161(+)